MGLGSILLILALLILVALLIARPLVKGAQFGPARNSQESHWLAERERALDALLELEFDRDVGKVPEDIYAEQRSRLMAQAAQAMRALDELDDTETQAVNAALEERREGRVSDAQLEALIAAHKKARQK